MSFNVVKRIREFAACDCETLGRDVLRRKIDELADDVEKSLNDMIAYYDRRIAGQAGVMVDMAKRNRNLATRVTELEQVVSKLNNAPAVASPVCARQSYNPGQGLTDGPVE